MNANEINRLLLAGNWEMADLKLFFATLNYKSKEMQSRTARQFSVGASVCFTNSKTGQTVVGRVTKINEKTIKVVADHTTWTVSPSLLRPA